jgi:hypothetical protein
MANAAHAELLNHEVYRTPFVVQPQFEYRDTPTNYRERFLGPGKLPDKMKVWRVQNSERGNVVASSYGFEDSPDAEIIALGLNLGKDYGAIGIGRHGNFLQWGYSDPPSQMTDAGKRLFLNCIYYIHRFDGKAPLVRTETSPRGLAMLRAAVLNRISGDKKEFFIVAFPERLWEKYHSDPNGLVAYYREDLELVYWDKVFCVDNELKSLGIASNRQVSSLQRLVVLLSDESHASTAGKLLKRYTNVSFETPEQWRQWLEASRDRIFFTDVGGYKFLVVPEGYLIGQKK